MTVKDVWGRIRGTYAGLVARDGDAWYFQVPPDATGTLITEWWAEDDAGNISHTAAVLTLDRGAIKCIRILRFGGRCIMRKVVRPEVSMVGGGTCRPIPVRPEASMSDRPSVCVMMPIRCRRMEVC